MSGDGVTVIGRQLGGFVTMSMLAFNGGQAEMSRPGWATQQVRNI